MALAARRLGAPAVVVMPTTAPPVKVEGARALGADVHFAGTTSIDRRTAAETLAAERRLTIVPPFDHADIIAGQGTAGLEILEQAPEVTTVYVPAGGGGLVSGVAAAVKRVAPAVRVVGVEPEGAPKMTRSLAAGAPVTLDRIDSIADGLLAVRPGDLTFLHVRALVDEVVTVSDDEIRGAMRFVAGHAKLVAEPSGAAAVAGALRLAPPGSPGIHVAIISGGNVEPALLAAVLSAPPGTLTA
jgi:threonine dehydratase